MTKSITANSRYAPGSSRGKPNRATFRLQVADVARGEQIQALRRQKARESENGKLTQPMVAEVVGVTLRAYQDWEASGDENPKGIDWQNAKRLAKFFGVDPEAVARRADEPEPGPWGKELHELRGQLDRIEHTQADLDEKLDVILAHIRAGLPLEEEADATEEAAA